MRLPITPEELGLERLKKEWRSKVGKVFCGCENYELHLLKTPHYFVDLNHIIPIVNNLIELPFIGGYNLSKNDLTKIRGNTNLFHSERIYVQFGTVRVKGNQREPVVASFDLVPMLHLDAKSELDRCQFISKRIEEDPHGKVKKEYSDTIEKVTGRAEDSFCRVNEKLGFLDFNKSGLLLPKLNMMERLIQRI